MKRDPSEFRSRFQAWKNGVPAYEDGKPLSFGERLTNTANEVAMGLGIDKGSLRRFTSDVNNITRSLGLSADVQRDEYGRMYASPSVAAAPALTNAFSTYAGKYLSEVGSKATRATRQYKQRFGDLLDLDLLTNRQINAAMYGRRKEVQAIKQRHAEYDRFPNYGDRDINIREDGTPIGHMAVSIDHGYIVPDFLSKTIDGIRSNAKGISRDAYSAGAEIARQSGFKGVKSGEHLLSPEKTTPAYRDFDTEVIANNGLRDNSGIVGNLKPYAVHNAEDAAKIAKQGKRYVWNGAPVVNLTKPKHFIPTKDLDMFDPRILDAQGNMHIDLNSKDIFRTMLPFAIGGGLWGQSNKYKNGKDLPRFKDGKRYISNGNGGWDRISDDIMADLFANLVITPNKNRIIESRKIDPYQEHIRQSVKNAGYVTDLLIEDDQRARSTVALQGRGELPLERVYPEFDLFAISPLLKDGIMYGSKKVADRLGFFVLKPGTYTRGIGMTDAGVQDAVKTGVFRGNPRGTEQTAKHFDKMFLRNRNNFRDIVRDTNIKGIESRYQSRTLTEEDFNALKEASKKYTRDEMSVDGNTITLRRGSSDPLSDYKNYQEYMDDINTTITRTEQMRNRVASGEVQVNNQLSEPMWFEDESGKMFLPQGRPITERFGTNSDYVSDGNPLLYWYADGRNAITKGHPYARSNYMVRVNNPQDYIPFMHELHKHPSFFKTPKLSDPNVELFRRGPFGITIRMRKPIKYKE